MAGHVSAKRFTRSRMKLGLGLIVFAGAYVWDIVFLVTHGRVISTAGAVGAGLGAVWTGLLLTLIWPRYKGWPRWVRRSVGTAAGGGVLLWTLCFAVVFPKYRFQGRAHPDTPLGIGVLAFAAIGGAGLCASLAVGNRQYKRRTRRPVSAG